LKINIVLDSDVLIIVAHMMSDM